MRTSGESRIPWVHRAKLGRWRAFWSTAWMVMFRNKAFRDEIMHPVDYHGAQRFRLVTVLLALLALLLWAGCIFYDNRADVLDDWDRLPLSLWVFILISTPITLFLSIFFATGLPSYFFHPRWLHVELQNRAVAMSHYVCGPLAYLPLSAVPLALATAIYSAHGRPVWVERFDLLLRGFAIGIVALCFAAWWFDLKRLANDTLRSTLRVVFVSVLAPFLMFIIALLVVVVLPAAVGYFILLFSALF